MLVFRQVKTFVVSLFNKPQVQNISPVKNDWTSYLDETSAKTKHFQVSPKNFWSMLKQHAPNLKQPTAWLNDTSFYMSTDNNEHHL
jgi:hypothetical protein